MRETLSNKKNLIHPDMTILDVVSRYRQTEIIFKKYDEKAGVCVCCEALFESLRNVAIKYGLDLEKLITDLENVIKENNYD